MNSDAQLVAHVSLGARRDLKADITRRTHLLIAISRYPAIVLFEALLSVLLLVLLSGLILAPHEMRQLQKIGEPTAEYLGFIQLGVVLWASYTYVAIVRSWAARARGRLIYVYETLGDEEALAVARMLAFPLFFAPVFFIIAMFGLLLYNAVTIADILDPGGPLLGWISLGLSVALVAVLILLPRFSRQEEGLFELVTWYTPGPFGGSGYPDLRPKALGQTEEDVATWKAEWEKLRTGGKKAEVAPVRSRVRRWLSRNILRRRAQP